MENKASTTNPYVAGTAECQERAAGWKATYYLDEDEDPCLSRIDIGRDPSD